MAVALDILSTLPDSVLCIILSKLPIRVAIQSSVLSKRWRFLYREMPTLILSPYLLTPPHLRPPTVDPFSVATVENIISSILQLQSLDLEGLCLSNDIEPWNPSPISSPWQFTRQRIANWLQCVSTKKVKKLILRDSPQRESPVPEALFWCTRLSFLAVYNYILTHIPTQFTGFNHLSICIFYSIQFSDESLGCFLSHCPLLRRLELVQCVGVQRPSISSLSITDLFVCVQTQNLTVNCPKLKNLKICNQVNELRVNGVLFQEISPAIKALQMHLGNDLTSLSLDSRVHDKSYISANRFLEIVGSFTSLKVFLISFRNLYVWPGDDHVPILNLLGRLPNLECFGLRGQLVLVTKFSDLLSWYSFLHLIVFTYFIYD